MWGATTRRYLEQIKELSDEQLAPVLEETRDFVKGTPSAANSEDSSNADTEFEDLLAFR